MRARIHTHQKIHLQANIPSPQLDNCEHEGHALTVSKASLFKEDISPEFWSTVSERFSLAPIEMWASKHSKEAPGSKKCCLRLKFFKTSWNGVTVQTIEGRISFPGSPIN